MPKSLKGGIFERQLAKRISLWWTQDLDEPRDDIFWRTSQSGGRATSRSKSGKKSNLHCGDLCAIDPVGEPLMKALTFELKRGYSKATIHDILDKSPRLKEQTYEGWFAHAKRDAERAGSISWCLIHARDRRRPLFFCPIRPDVYNFHLHYSTFWWGRTIVHCSLLDDFLLVPPGRIRELVDSKKKIG